MKKLVRIASLGLILVMLLGLLTACGTSAVDNVNNLISKIGSVTESSGPAIEAAEKAYNALSDSDKSKVSSAYEVLVAAREAFDALTNKAEEVVEGAAEAATEAAETVAETVTETVTEAAETVAETVTETVTEAAETVTEAVEAEPTLSPGQLAAAEKSKVIELGGKLYIAMMECTYRADAVTSLGAKINGIWYRHEVSDDAEVWHFTFDIQFNDQGQKVYEITLTENGELHQITDIDNVLAAEIEAVKGGAESTLWVEGVSTTRDDPEAKQLNANGVRGIQGAMKWNNTGNAGYGENSGN